MKILIKKCIDCDKQLNKWAHYRKNIRCRFCATKRKVGKNAPNWKGGLTIGKCLDCGGKCWMGSTRCKACWNLYIKSEEGRRLTYNWKGGWFSKHNHCIDCNGKVSPTKLRCRSCSVKFRVGVNTNNWKGGISREPYSFDFNEELKELIRKRDLYKCRLCKTPQEECFRKLCVHHIDYDKQNCNPGNLITLCARCNSKVNYDREKWCEQFQNLPEFRV